MDTSVMPKEERHQDGFEGQWWEYPILRNALMAGVLAGIGFVLAHAGFISEQGELAFYVVAIPLGGYHWAREALEELLAEREIGIDFLILAATIGSGFLGLWDEAAFLVFLYGAAEGLEEFTYARTRSAIRALLDLAPKEAHVLREGREVTIAAAELRPGDRFLVRPGESIPTDGMVKSGTSSLDESAVTGESIPVDKEPGMPVFAGTLNHQGALEVEATGRVPGQHLIQNHPSGGGGSRTERKNPAVDRAVRTSLQPRGPCHISSVSRRPLGFGTSL